MIKRLLIGVCAFASVALFSLAAYADQSIGFQEYFKAGFQAFKHHNYKEALRCFKIAEIYDPTDYELKKYLKFLEKEGVGTESSLAQTFKKSIGYQYYLKEGLKALDAHADDLAVRYFRMALIFYPDSREIQGYLDIVAHRSPVFQGPPVTPEEILPQPQPQPTVIETPPVIVNMPAPKAAPIYVPVANPKQPPATLSLSQITNNGQSKPKLQIEYHSSLVLQGKNIQRFLVVDEGFIGVRTLDADRMVVDGLKIGSTFLHIWDETGRYTFYIEVIFPKSVTSGAVVMPTTVWHSKPFVVTYANDWNTYYLGRNASLLKRQSYDFSETLALTGETPYGMLDASGTYEDFNAFSRFDSYTVGLSQIPLEGTSNFNLRGFDALRYTSPLTMPGTILRGEFADVDFMDNLLGLSVSHGEEELPPGFYTEASLSSPFSHSYIDALRLTLFPHNQNDQYAFNFATAYGPDRSLQPYLSNHVYSVQGQHKFNDFLSLNAEEGNDSNHDSQLASLKWQQGPLMSAFNFRNINKNYATISTLPANQGETGASWVTQGEFKRITLSSFVEAYQEHLEPNPDHPNALNYDGNEHLKVDINPSVWVDSDFDFMDTPGELSTQRNFQFNQRLSKSFGVWNSLKGTVFTGAGYQNSRVPGSSISDYDQEDVIAGIQFPLTQHVSAYSNYEYDWLDQPSSAGRSNPNVINSGIEYQKQFNPKFSITSQVYYRDELGVSSNDSLLSGQDSVIFSSSFNYNPSPDVSIFADGDASRVVSHIGNLPYDDFEVHVGLRLTFGGVTYWDPLGTVSGIIYRDKAGTGQYVAGDQGIPDVKVKIGDKETTTDKYGRYSVRIRAKGVEVIPVLDTLPGGLLFSTPQSLNVEIVQGRTIRANFGLTSQTGIYGIVFVDKSGNGTPNDNDSFIGKVRVILDGKIVQRSDSHGTFYFRNVAPGKHTITIDINSLTLDMLPKIKLNNNIDVAEGTNYMFNIPLQVKQALVAQE